MLQNSISMNHSQAEQAGKEVVKMEDSKKWIPSKLHNPTQSSFILEENLLYSMRKAYLEVLNDVDVSQLAVSLKRFYSSIGNLVGFEKDVHLLASKLHDRRPPPACNIVVADLHRSKKIVPLLLEDVVSFRVDKLGEDKDQLWVRWAVLQPVNSCEFVYTGLSFWWNPIIGDREMTMKAISHDLKCRDPSSPQWLIPDGIQWNFNKT